MLVTVTPGEWGPVIISPDFSDELAHRVGFYDDDCTGCECTDADKQACANGHCALDPDSMCSEHECPYGEAVVYVGVLCYEIPYAYLHPTDFLEISPPAKGSYPGYVYAVQLMPLAYPRRIKMGYTTNLSSRMKTYHTANPEAILIGCWPGDLYLEKTILQRTAALSHVVGREVFDVEDVESLLVCVTKECASAQKDKE